MSEITNVQQVKVNLMTSAQYEEAETQGTVNENQFYVITDKTPVYNSDLQGYQTTSNLVTYVTSLSTDSQYPSALCVYSLSKDSIARGSTINEVYLADSTSGSIAIPLRYATAIYKYKPTGACTFSFDTSGIDIDITPPSTAPNYYNAFTFELCVDMSTTVYSLTFPNSVVWQDNTAPTMSSTGVYFLVFRTINGGTTWYGNLQGKW